MERIYPVLAGHKHAGKVSVEQRGLYYHFSCRCILFDNSIFRLLVSCNTGQHNLGVLVPQEGSLILETTIPVKRIGEGDLSFFMIPKKEPHTGTFIPICPEEPFAYISRLKQSFLVLKDEKPGICITHKQGYFSES